MALSKAGTHFAHLGDLFEIEIDLGTGIPSGTMQTEDDVYMLTEDNIYMIVEV